MPFFTATESASLFATHVEFDWGQSLHGTLPISIGTGPFGLRAFGDKVVQITMEATGFCKNVVCKIR